MSEELRGTFRADLAQVDEQLGRLLGDVTRATSEATEAFLANDLGAAVVIVGYRELATPVYAGVEDKVAGLLARQAPVAGDLRYLLAVLAAVRELELAASLAAEIGRMGAQDVSDQVSGRARSLIRRLGTVCTAMWEQVTTCWTERLPTASTSLEAAAEDHSALLSALTAEIAASSWPTPVTMQMTLATRYFERLGDHAIEIGRRVDVLRRAAPGGG